MCLPLKPVLIGDVPLSCLITGVLNQVVRFPAGLRCASALEQSSDSKDLPGVDEI